MINFERHLKPAILLVALLSAFSAQGKPGKRILVFFKTVGFYYTSIPAGIKALQKSRIENGIKVDTTSNSTFFKKKTLKRYDAVVFLSTTGDVLN
jgi:hypothetical protein